MARLERIIIDVNEIKYWRASCGLLGIMTAVEMELVERKYFKTSLVTYQYSSRTSITKAEYFKSISQIRNTPYISAEIFINPYGLALSLIVYTNTPVSVPKANQDCTWDYAAARCKNPAYCAYQPIIGEKLDESCKIKTDPFIQNIYTTYKNAFPMLSKKGIATSVFPGDYYGGQMADLMHLLSQVTGFNHSLDMMRMMCSLSDLAISWLIDTMQAEVNDGYWIRTIPVAVFMSYWFPIQYEYEVFKAYLDTIWSLAEGTSPISQYTKFLFNQPSGWRYATLDPSLASKYQIPDPTSTGEWVIFDVPQMLDNTDDYHWGFAQLEYEWQKIPGARPHIAKIWGYDYNMVLAGQKPTPYMDSFAGTVLSASQKADFAYYQAIVDPGEVFFGGSATKMFR